MSVDELEQPILGKYRVISSITAESSVFTYIANSNIKTVFVRAISATHPDFNPAYLVACLREFEISNQLAGNTGLVSVLEYGSSDDTHYFIYEFIEGGSLHEQIAISRNRPLNNQTIGAVGRDVCNALEVLHSNGLFHGDLNPKNILYNKSKQAFLKSYGTSAIAAEDEDKLGCDIYALGAILYKMATCQQYRPGKSQPALLLNRNLTPALSTIISATLNEFGEKRYYNLALLQEHFGLAIDPDISPEHLLEQLVKPALPEIVLEPLAPEIEESSAEEVVEPELEAEVESSAEEVVELELEAEIESSAEEVVELELEAEIESAAEEVVEPELEAEVESAAEEVVELELEAEVEAAEE
ncbi:protein kinase, partial [Candidatus Chlorohelix sp.]|uniref:protein kinase domain-containing protein n=1 Tax=Candidatus Chlorohelix sp. TaxID=3139201 RepID=UPI00304C534E